MFSIIYAINIYYGETFIYAMMALFMLKSRELVIWRENLERKGDTSQKLTLMKTSADSLKKSADALNDSSLWGKKKIKKKDEKTGEEIEAEDYDWDKITKAVKSFVEDYNDVVKEAGESNTKDV